MRASSASQAAGSDHASHDHASSKHAEEFEKQAKSGHSDSTSQADATSADGSDPGGIDYSQFSLSENHDADGGAKVASGDQLASYNDAHIHHNANGSVTLDVNQSDTSSDHHPRAEFELTQRFNPNTTPMTAHVDETIDKNPGRLVVFQLGGGSKGDEVEQFKVVGNKVMAEEDLDGHHEGQGQDTEVQVGTLGPNGKLDFTVTMNGNTVTNTVNGQTTSFKVAASTANTDQEHMSMGDYAMGGGGSADVVSQVTINAMKVSQGQ